MALLCWWFRYVHLICSCSYIHCDVLPGFRYLSGCLFSRVSVFVSGWPCVHLSIPLVGVYLSVCRMHYCVVECNHTMHIAQGMVLCFRSAVAQYQMRSLLCRFQMAFPTCDSHCVAPSLHCSMFVPTAHYIADCSVSVRFPGHYRRSQLPGVVWIASGDSRVHIAIYWLRHQYRRLGMICLRYCGKLIVLKYLIN